jgi:hypothetical protein
MKIQLRTKNYYEKKKDLRTKTKTRTKERKGKKR